MTTYFLDDEVNWNESHMCHRSSSCCYV